MSHAVARLTRAATTGATYPKPMLTRDWHHGAKYALEWGEDPPSPPLNAAGLISKHAKKSHFSLETTRQPPGNTWGPPTSCSWLWSQLPTTVLWWLALPVMRNTAWNPKIWHFAVYSKIWPLTKVFYISTYPNHIRTMQYRTWLQHTLKISGL